MMDSDGNYDISVPEIDGRKLVHTVVAQLMHFHAMQFGEERITKFAMCICHQCGRVSPNITFLTCCEEPTHRHLYSGWEALDLLSQWN